MPRHKVIPFIISAILIATITLTIYSCSKNADAEHLRPDNTIADIILTPPPIIITPVLEPDLNVPAIMTTQEFAELEPVDQKFASEIQEAVNQLYFIDDSNIQANFIFNADLTLVAGPVDLGPVITLDPSKTAFCTICIGNLNNRGCYSFLRKFYDKYKGDVKTSVNSLGNNCYRIVLTSPKLEIESPVTPPVFTDPGFGGSIPVDSTSPTVSGPNVSIPGNVFTNP